jgi:hypothetical protein
MAVVCAAVVVMIVGSYRRYPWLGLGWVQNGDGKLRLVPNINGKNEV